MQKLGKEHPGVCHEESACAHTEQLPIALLLLASLSTGFGDSCGRNRSHDARTSRLSWLSRKIRQFTRCDRGLPLNSEICDKRELVLNRMVANVEVHR